MYTLVFSICEYYIPRFLQRLRLLFENTAFNVCVVTCGERGLVWGEEGDCLGHLLHVTGQTQRMGRLQHKTQGVPWFMADIAVIINWTWSG